MINGRNRKFQNAIVANVKDYDGAVPPVSLLVRIK